MSNTPVVESPKPAAIPSKTVILTCVDGVWSGVVNSIDHLKHPFTIRDFNQLQLLLKVLAKTDQRESYLRYRKIQQEETKKAALAALKPAVKKP